MSDIIRKGGRLVPVNVPARETASFEAKTASLTQRTGLSRSAVIRYVVMAADAEDVVKGLQATIQREEGQ